MDSIPKCFPATGTDVGVHITRSVTRHRIGIRLSFDDRLDSDRLTRASRLALDAEPVVGCAWVTDVARPHWARMRDLDSAEYFSLVETRDIDEAMDSFQATEIRDEGPQAEVALFRAPDRDEVGIKISHVLADGQAAKQYAYLLAAIYTSLGADPGFAPRPNLTPRPTPADVWENLAPAQRAAAKHGRSWSAPTWPKPASALASDELTYRAAVISPDGFRALKAYGKARGATVNDMMLTAYFRSCITAFDPEPARPHSLMCTADFRRYLPEVETPPISNISISGSLDIERVSGETFDDTLRRVHERMAVWADACYGARAAYQAERMATRSYRLTKLLIGTMLRSASRSSKTYPFFTNIGILDDSRLSFAGVVPAAGYVYGPSGAGPSAVAAVSTYRDALTVCMGSCEKDPDAGLLGTVLTRTVEELRGSGCLQQPVVLATQGVLS